MFLSADKEGLRDVRVSMGGVLEEAWFILAVDQGQGWWTISLKKTVANAQSPNLDPVAIYQGLSSKSPTRNSWLVNFSMRLSQILHVVCLHKKSYFLLILSLQSAG